VRVSFGHEAPSLASKCGTRARAQGSLPSVVLVLGLVACAGPTIAAQVTRPETARTLREADSLVRTGRFEGSADRYVDVLRAWPDSEAIAARSLGVLWRAGRDEEAYRWARRLAIREPGSPDVMFDLGVTCGFLVNSACADSAFARAIALDSSFVDGYCELGFLAQAGGRMTEAVRWMETAQLHAPDDDFAVSGLAQVLIPAGQPARARDLMRPRLAANRRARAYGGRSMLTLYGWSLLALGDTAGSDTAFSDVMTRLLERERAGETSYQLYRERAAILALRGERDAAITQMRIAVDHGWRLYGAWTIMDPMFASVIHDPRVIALVERMRQAVRGMRTRLGMPSELH
jgi:Flp pilus assembly protein TadD